MNISKIVGMYFATVEEAEALRQPGEIIVQDRNQYAITTPEVYNKTLWTLGYTAV